MYTPYDNVLLMYMLPLPPFPQALLDVIRKHHRAVDLDSLRRLVLATEASPSQVHAPVDCVPQSTEHAAV